MDSTKKTHPLHDRPLRVLIVSPAFEGGGGERCARELFLALKAGSAVDPTMVVRVGPRSPQPGVLVLDTSVDRVLNHVTLLPGVHDWTRRSGTQFLRSIKREDFDVVHLHGVVHCGLPLRGLSDLAARFPTVWTLHDEWAVTAGLACDLRHVVDPRDRRRCSRHTCFVPDVRSTFVARQLRRFPIRPRVVIAPSRWLLAKAERCQSFAGADFRLVRNGLQLLEEPARHRPREEARQLLGVTGNRPIVLLIASAFSVPHKGMRYAVEALNLIANGGTHPPAVILCGGDAARMRGRIPASMPVVTTVASTNDELCRVYRAADCTVIPSLGDNFPYVAIESLACGSPLVAADCNGLKEIIGESGGGVLAKAADAGSLATAMASLLADPGRRALAGAAGQKWVEANCQMRCYLDATLAAYRCAADPRMHVGAIAVSHGG